MSQARYSVIFNGRIVEGADPAKVRANLAKLFKVDADRIETMFAGKPIVIKKGLEPQQAQNYRAALNKAGAEVSIVDDGAAAAPPPPPPPAPAAETETRDAAASGPRAAGTAPADDLPPAARRDSPPVAPDFTVAEVGVTIVEPQTVAPPDFDTTQFDLAEVGVTLVEAPPVPPAEFDTSGLTLDPPGTQLTETKPAPPANFDTSGLSLADNE